MEKSSDRPRRRLRQPRWGVRALLFLVLAAASTVTASLVTEAGAGLVLLTVAGQLVGLGGAVVCSVRGLRSAGWLPRE